MTRIVLQPPLPLVPTWPLRYKRLAFSPPLAAKTRKGEKTLTRRAVPQPHVVGPFRRAERIVGSLNGFRFSDPAEWTDHRTAKGFLEIASPLAVGDRCWVTEDWQILLRGEETTCDVCGGTGRLTKLNAGLSSRPRVVKCGSCKGEGGERNGFVRVVRYPADGEEIPVREADWPLFNQVETRPSKNPDPYRERRGRFMYRAFARTFVEILEVRVERLGAITVADAISEGYEGEVGPDDEHDDQAPALVWFRETWDRVNGAGSWDPLRWVFVYRYRAVKEGE